MTKYIALLRCVNISGKNKIVMKELQASFVRRGYTDAKTYLNSGNIVFSCAEKPIAELSAEISTMILEDFSMCIPVLIISQEQLRSILASSPDWWNSPDKGIYDNLIFILSDSTVDLIIRTIGEPSRDIERISAADNAIFWSFDLKTYSKANWWKKTAAAGITEQLTIRTANTVIRLSEM